MFDVAVLGAGLAGLSAARDLKRSGADVIVIEARDRVGGRVESVTLPDGRAVQAGGEVFGPGHWAYRELVDELGLAVEPSYVADPGEISWGLVDGVYVGDDVPWMSEPERRDEDRIERAFVELAATVDPEDPWAHPDAAALDAMSVAQWLRHEGALPAVHRRHELASLSLACDSPERTSLLAELRKHAALGGDGFYDLERWESLRVADGSAAVALACAEELGPEAIRFGTVVRRIEISAGRTRVTLSGGETIGADAVVCTIPAGPLRAVEIAGLSDARLRSLRSQRQALAAKVVAVYEVPFWQGAARTDSPSPSGYSARHGHRAPGCCRCWSHPSGCPRSWRRRTRFGRAPWSTDWWRCTARPPGSRSRCSSARGASIRSRRATSRVGRRAT